MGPTTSASTEADGVLLTVLGYELCRYVLHYFDHYSTEVATVDDLGTFVCEHGHEGREEDPVRITLRHSTLPRLADAGLLQYDARSHTVRYRSHPAIESWVSHVGERGEVPG